jgi:hypothetical protein
MGQMRTLELVPIAYYTLIHQLDLDRLVLIRTKLARIIKNLIMTHQKSITV